MAQYIDKDALLAEIERLRQKVMGVRTDFADGQKGVLTEILSFIKTLEVKEVDLEEEICTFFSKNPIPYEHITEWPLLKNCAIHFFELGLKAQHSSIDIPNIDDIFEEEGIDPNSKDAKIFKECYCMALEKLKAQKGEL